MRTDNRLEEIEVELLVQAVAQQYGYDFRNYSRASLTRRVRQARERNDCSTITDLTNRLLHNSGFFQKVLGEFSIVVTEMFRDPQVYSFIRDELLGHLHTYPFLKVWHAGCATGEEVYSLAIILHEAGLLERTTIYATDFNEAALEVARQGIYPIERVRSYLKNYTDSGGRRSFSEYYHARYDNVIMAKFLRDRMTFARHNLVTDASFGEMHLIFCRNVLIYFNRKLQDRVFQLFSESLVHRGFLCLGSKEDMRFSPTMDDYIVFDRKTKIYQKKTT